MAKISVNAESAITSVKTLIKEIERLKSILGSEGLIKDIIRDEFKSLGFNFKRKKCRS